jgi:hypothetical protein
MDNSSRLRLKRLIKEYLFQWDIRDQLHLRSIIGTNMYNNDIDYFICELVKSYTWFTELDNIRKIVLIILCFKTNMGIFNELTNLHKAFKDKDYDKVAIKLFIFLKYTKRGLYADYLQNITLFNAMRYGKDYKPIKSPICLSSSTCTNE